MFALPVEILDWQESVPAGETGIEEEVVKCQSFAVMLSYTWVTDIWGNLIWVLLAGLNAHNILGEMVNCVGECEDSGSPGESGN